MNSSCCGTAGQSPTTTPPPKNRTRAGSGSTGTAKRSGKRRYLFDILMDVLGRLLGQLRFTCSKGEKTRVKAGFQGIGIFCLRFVSDSDEDALGLGRGRVLSSQPIPSAKNLLKHAGSPSGGKNPRRRRSFPAAARWVYGVYCWGGVNRG